MLVVGTPRPSSSILGEVADNGFFDKPLPGTSAQTSEDDNDWGSDPLVEDDDARRDSRSRSESFHEMYDEKAKLPPIVLAGSQPLLTRQLNIVTNLQSTLPDKSHQWGYPSKEELLEDEALEREETALLERWRGVGGRGKPYAPSPGINGPAGRKKSNANSSALVPASGLGEIYQELLPKYEDGVRILVIFNAVPNTAESRVEIKTADVHDAGGRRVQCQICEFHPSANHQPPDSVIEAYIKGSDALSVVANSNDWTKKWISRATSMDKVVVVTSAFGGNAADAKRTATRLGVHLDSKGNNWIEIAARDVALRNAKARGERRSTLTAMEKQLRKTEKGAHGSCLVM